MRKHPLLPFLLATISLLPFELYTTYASAAPQYTLTAIPMPANATNASDPIINQSHEIALSFIFNSTDPLTQTTSNVGRPYAGTIDNLSPLPLPTGSGDARPLGINNQGAIVGYVNDGNGVPHPSLWNNGGIVILDQGTMPSGIASGLPPFLVPPSMRE